MKSPAVLLLLAAAAADAAACKKIEPGRLDAVRALRARVEPRFQTPTDGRLTAAELEAYIKVRKATAAAGSEPEAARAAGLDQAEVDWIRARVIEATAYLDARRVAETSQESYGRALATLRDARRAAPDAATASRLDAQIATLERERATLRRPDPASGSIAANAARIAPKRAELEALAR